MKKLKLNKKQKDLAFNKILNRRIIVFTCLIVLLFSVILIKLSMVMIKDNNKYKKSLNKLTHNVVEGPSAPRGRIYDRNYNIIVDNKAVKTIYYKKSKTVNTKKEIELAYLVSSHLNIDLNKLTTTMQKEFWLKKYPKKAEKLITDKEWKKLDERKLSSEDITNMKFERVSEEELKKFTDSDLKAAYLYYLMNKGYAYDEKIIKTDVSEEEYAYVAENNKELKGFNTKLDWERVYPYGDTFRSMLGNVSTPSQGIPQEDKAYYLANGYSLSDRVGISYLEKEYEKYLKGTKEKYKVMNSNSLELIKDGKRGQDVVLTIDIKLQQEVERILSEQVVKAKSEVNTEYYDHSFVVIQDPSNGEILAMAGKQAVKENNNYVAKDYTPAILTSPMTPGSVVKGASMLVGYNSGVIKIGDYQVDECVKIAGAPEKCSYHTLGRINDITALAKSSNVYQFKIAMKILGVNYYPGVRLPLKQEAFDMYRNMYHSFGLGVKTEVDLPIESTGVSGKGHDVSAGNLLDFVMGQYETYTEMQLSQYITTIANGGERLQPHLLKEVHEQTDSEEIGKTVYLAERKVLNKIDTKPEYMARVQEGFRAVTMSSDGYGRGYIYNNHDSAGKTGTSQSFIDTNDDGKIDTETISSAFLGYMPSNNPKMTIAVASPNSSHPNSSTDYASLVTLHITKEITGKYLEMYGE